MRSIHNLPVIPEEGEHYKQSKHRPMTRRELKCDFRSAIFMKHPESEACWEALIRYKLASAVYFYSRHWIKEKDGTVWEGWRHNLAKLAEAGIYIFHVGMHWYGEEESLPSDTLLWCFCRGASKQYDLLTTVSISPTNRWGAKSYFRDGENAGDIDWKELGVGVADTDFQTCPARMRSHF